MLHLQQVFRLTESRSRRSQKPDPVWIRGWLLSIALLATYFGGLSRVEGQILNLAWNPSNSTNVSGYYLHYGRNSRQYTSLLDTGTGTTGTISNLLAGATYYFAVTAHTPQSIESDYSNEITYTVPGGGGPTTNTLLIEAESGEITGLQVGSDATASGGEFLQSQTPNSGSVAFAINLASTADYYVWCRTVSPDNGTDSFFVSVDNGAQDIYDTTDSVSTDWQWTRLRGRNAGNPWVLTLSSGAHVLLFQGREAFTKLDSLYFTSDPDFVPTGGGGSTQNGRPTLSAIANVTINENSGQRTVNLSGIGDGDAGSVQTLTVSASSGNPGLIPTPTVNYTSPSSTGSLTFTPVTDANGTATITVTVDDGQGQNNTFSRTFTVTVRAVNDPGITVWDEFALPYPGARGTYDGLFYETNEVNQTSSGSFSITPNVRGTYSGKLKLGSSSYAFSGKVDQNYKATNSVSRKGTTPLTVELNFRGGQSNQVVGRVTDGSWQAPLIGDRALFSSKYHPAPSAGSYTVLIPGQDDPDLGPEGDGFGTVKIDTGGGVRLAGTLADGTKVSLKVPLGLTGQWPLYIPLYHGSGSVLSWMAVTNRSEDDLNGRLNWIKPASAKSKYYSGGFTNESSAIGSRFLRPVAPGKVLELIQAELVFAGGNLGNTFTNEVVFGSNGAVLNLSAPKLTLKINPGTGLLVGTVVVPDSGKAFKFRGAAFQKQDAASGFLLGTNKSARFVLQ